MSTYSPVYLFADSQLLFWTQHAQLFLKSILSFITDENPSAAYIGASNGDEQEYYQLFEAAMESIGINNCRMILSEFSEQDKNFLEQANIVLLAGGDVKKGWDIFESSGIKEAVHKRYNDGAVLMGISAGAVQLGTCSLYGDDNKLLTTFQILPFIIDVHNEKDEWSALIKTLKIKDGFEKGIGIPSGAGFIYHPDHTVEPLRHALTEISLKEGNLSTGLLFPGSEKEAPEPIH